MIPVRFHHLKAAARSLAHARASLDGDERDTTSAMERGSAVHAIVLATTPVIAYPGKVRNGKAWEAFEAENAGATILTMTEYEKASRMAEAVLRHRDAMSLLTGVREKTVTWRILGRDCRGTPDVAVYDSHVVELKTSSTADPDRFAWQARRLGYHGQLAWYMDGVIAAGLGSPTSAYVVAVESSSPYPVTVLRLTDRAIEKGRGFYHLALERLLGAERSNEWPGYVQSIVDLDVPDDLELAYAEDAEAA